MGCNGIVRKGEERPFSGEWHISTSFASGLSNSAIEVKCVFPHPNSFRAVEGVRVSDEWRLEPAPKDGLDD
jgi:hypothetical protein